MKTLLIVMFVLAFAKPVLANDAQVMDLIEVLQQTHDELVANQSKHNAETNMAFHQPTLPLPRGPVPTPVQPVAKPVEVKPIVLGIGNVRQ